MSSNIIPDGMGNFELAPGVTDASGLLGDLLAQNFGALVPAGGSVSLIKVPLTAAQLQTLNSDPVLIVDAPGAGKALIPLYALLVFTPGVVPFTNSNDNAGIFYGSDLVDGYQASTAFGFDGTQLVSQLGTAAFTAFAAGSAFDPTLVFNQPFYFGDGGESDALVGDGTAVLYVVYTTIE